MKNLFIILFILVGFVAKAQFPSQQNPTQFSTGWFKQGWPQADSGHILAVRAPNFTPRFPGTIIMYRNPSGDTAVNYWTGNRWISISASGTITASNGLTLTSGDLKLGGTLSQFTNIADNGNQILFSGTVDKIFRTTNGTAQYTATTSPLAASLLGNNSSTLLFSEINALDSAAVLFGGKNGDFYNRLAVEPNKIILTVRSNTTPYSFILNTNGQLQATGMSSFPTVDTSYKALVMDGSGNVYLRAGDNGGGGSGLTSVGLSMPSAFTVTGSPLTSNGSIAVSGAGTSSQYIRGNGTLATTDTGMIPNFYLKVRGLLSGTSPITFNQFSGAIGINNANTSGIKGAATFSSAFSDNGSGTIDLLSLVSAGSCTGCNLNIDAKGRITGYSDGAGGATNNVNIGSGFRWLNSITQELRTVANSATITWDSISTANTLTPKADTSLLATQFDVSLVNNGLSRLGDTTQLGGVLIHPTHISGGPSGFAFQLDSSASISLFSGLEYVSSGIGSFIQMSDSVMNIGSSSIADFTSITFSPTRIKFTAADGAGSAGDVWTNTGSGYAHWAAPTGGGATLNNIGSGFRLVATSTGNIKTVYNSNTILWDSTSNSNGLTPKVDTSVIATQYDLLQSGNFIVGDVAPSSSLGSNGNYFLNKRKSQWYLKSSGSWASPQGYIYSDTLQPINTSFVAGTTFKLKEVWDTAAMSWSYGIARNENAIGNDLLTYKDDPVFNFGWNVNYNNALIDTWKAGYLFHFESNYDTKHIGQPWFERHETVLFKPGSNAYNNYGPGERIWSVNASQVEYDAHVYGTMGEFYLQWKNGPGQSHTRYLNATPNGLTILKQFRVDSVDLGGTFITFDDVGTFYKLNNSGKIWYPIQRSGFKDSAILFADGGDFVFKRASGSNRTLIDQVFGVGVGQDGSSGKAPVQFANGQIFAHAPDEVLGNFAVRQTSVYGLSLNVASGTDKRAYLDIRNADQGQNFDAYFTSNITDNDSVTNPLRFFIQRYISGSPSSANLYGNWGYQFILNSANTFGTKFVGSPALDNDGNNIADFVWLTKDTGDVSQSERMRLTSAGYLRLTSMDTDISAPPTTGTTKMVITDANGQLSFDNIPTGSTTLYTGDGTLGSNRTVTGGSNSLTFNGIFNYRVNANAFILDKSTAAAPYTQAVLGIDNRFQIGYTPTATVYSKGSAIIIDTNNNAGMGVQMPTTAPRYASGLNTYLDNMLVEGGQFVGVTNISSNTTLDLEKYYIRIDATSGNVTVTLPAASTAFGASVGIAYVFKRLDNTGNTVTIQRNGTPGTDTIDGATSITLTTQYQVKSLQCSSTSTWDVK